MTYLGSGLEMRRRTQDKGAALRQQYRMQKNRNRSEGRNRSD
jgi:hypothetical protein